MGLPPKCSCARQESREYVPPGLIEPSPNPRFPTFTARMQASLCLTRAWPVPGIGARLHRAGANGTNTQGIDALREKSCGIVFPRSSGCTASRPAAVRTRPLFSRPVWPGPTGPSQPRTHERSPPFDDGGQISSCRRHAGSRPPKGTICLGESCRLLQSCFAKLGLLKKG